MIQKYIPRITVIILSALIVLSAVNALAASNTVSSNRLDEINGTPIAFTANSLKPAACTMNLTAIHVCTGGNCDAPSGVINQLILGTSGNERIRGRGGQDCILGGDGIDDIIGNNGGDICIGGAGNDIFTTCEICTGGPGIDDFNSCGTVTDRGPGE